MSGTYCHTQCGFNPLQVNPSLVGGLRPLTLGTAWLQDGAARVGADGSILSLNDSLAYWLNVTPASAPGLSFPALMGARHASWEAELRKFLASEANFAVLELAGQHGLSPDKLRVELFRDGGTRFLRVHSVPPMAREMESIFPESCWARFAAAPLGHRLLRAEAQLENLISRWPGIIFSQRPDFSFLFVSPKVEELTGVPAADWRRQAHSFWDVVHEADAEILETRMLTEARKPSGMTSTFRVRHIHTGRVSYLWEHRQALYSSNGLLLGFEGIWLDVTRQTIAERRLINLAWNENVGALSVGMAHDFCNMMSGIVGLSDVFHASVEAGPVQEGMGLIRETALQASQLAHRMRKLQQGTPGERIFGDLNQEVTSLADILEKVFSRRVKFKACLAPGQLPIYVDTVELQQVMINLALNAADAMPDGGNLTFYTTRFEKMPEASNVQGTLPRLPIVRFSVQDTGTGIPSAFLDSIFDAFFTTKPLGKGSGLGLYNTKLFAEKHGAAVSVESREGVGSTFHLWFAEASFTEAEEGQESAKPPLRHTLLVLGPTTAARDSAVMMLRRQGYYVFPTQSSAEALEAINSPQFQFTGVIVLCAGKQPEDPALLRRLRPPKSGLKLFLGVLGWNHDELDGAVLESVDGILPLDVTAGECAARLKSMLDG